MNIHSLPTSALLTGQSDATSSTSTTATPTNGMKSTATTPALRALQASEQRLQTQFQSASTQISSLGQLQSALSGVLTASTSLAALGGQTSDADTGKAVDGFVSAFNAAVTSAHTGSTGAGDQLLQTAAARRAGHQLDRSVAGHKAHAAALRAIGVRQGTDGTLTVDTKVLAAARAADPAGVRSTLAALGKDVGTTVAHTLGSGGAVATSLGALSARVKALQTQYGAYSALEQQATATATTSLADWLPQ